MFLFRTIHLDFQHFLMRQGASSALKVLPRPSLRRKAKPHRRGLHRQSLATRPLSALLLPHPLKTSRRLPLTPVLTHSTTIVTHSARTPSPHKALQILQTSIKHRCTSFYFSLVGFCSSSLSGYHFKLLDLLSNTV